MKNVKVVIGAGYGDEGKGLMSRFFSLKEKNPIVLLTNGSAQRGHTVDLKNGERHIFHHFGSGTLDNVPSYFPSTFMIHPMTFHEEYNALSSKGITPEVYLDRNCLIVTPIDMAITQIYEQYLAEIGKREFGSCGLGTWETTERKKDGQLAFTVQDFLTYNPIDILIEIYSGWFFKRMEYLGIEFIPESFSQWKNLNGLLPAFSTFIEDLNFLFKHSKIISFDEVYHKYDTLIFENAQGLMLDKDYLPNEGWNTSTHTGLDYVIDLLNPYFDDCNIEVCYVSRTYLTRHGDGPFPTECPKELINADMVDMTNQPNPFQGHLRYGKLDKYAINCVTMEDARKIPFDKLGNVKFSYAYTHCNEYPPIIKKQNGIINSYFSFSPFAEDIFKPQFFDFS